MTPKNFLLVGGIVLVVVGLLGMIGVLGPTADDSIFGSAWWFDSAENWTHLIIGIVAVILLFAAPVPLQKPVVMIVGILALLAGLYSLVLGEKLWGANLENPADTILHIIVGLWAVLSARGKQSTMMGGSGMPSTM